MKLRVCTTIAATSLFILPATQARLIAQPSPGYTVLHTFTGPDGATPYGNLISDLEGNLYGTTIGGGDITNTPCQNNPWAYGCGVVYKLDRHGNESVLYTFKGGTDGAFPATELLLDWQGNLYGTARGGGLTTNSACDGLQGCGVVFKLDRHGNESVLYSFKGGAEGFGVSTGLVRDDAGNLYGATVGGGILNANCAGGGLPGNCGVVFKIDPKGNETVLHSFTGNEDGFSPYGSLIRDWQGNLFGVTDAGGNTTSPFCGTTILNLAGVIGCGVVFKIDHSGNFSVVHTFDGTDGGPYPDGWLATDLAGNIYGLTGNGGNLGLCGGVGCGTIFKIDRHGNESVLYDLGGPATELPFFSTSFGSVVRDLAGNLYGAAYAGGDTTDPQCAAAGGCGVVFKLDARGYYSVLYTFKGGTDGANPQGSLYLDLLGNLYGTTTTGGDPTCNCGTVFKISLQHNQNAD